MSLDYHQVMHVKHSRWVDLFDEDEWETKAMRLGKITRTSSESMACHEYAGQGMGWWNRKYSRGVLKIGN